MKMNGRHYKTSDLALATTISLSFPIESVEQTGGRRVVFVFRESEALDELVEAYWRCELKVEPQRFFDQLRTIKTRIYSIR